MAVGLRSGVGYLLDRAPGGGRGVATGIRRGRAVVGRYGIRLGMAIRVVSHKGGDGKEIEVRTGEPPAERTGEGTKTLIAIKVGPGVD